MSARPENRYQNYHAHVYFGPDTLEAARALRERAGAELPVGVGRLHEKNVGPHPCWSFQLAFDAAGFDTVIGWLERERQGLDVLVHGLTGDDLADHTLHAMWLGTPHVLDISLFQRAGGA